MQPIQDTRERFHRLGAISTSIMQQNNATIMPLLLHALKDDVRSGLRPILRIDILQDYQIIEVFSNFQRSQFAKLRWAGVRRVRRAEQCSGTTCYRLEQ